MSPDPLVVSVSEACDCLGVSRQTIYNLFERGQLTRVEGLGRVARIRYADILELVGGASAAAEGAAIEAAP